MGSKILVTGGKGFVGTHLMKRLYEEGFDAYSLDIKETNKLKIDITDYSTLSKAVDYLRPDCIIHLAAQADVRKSIENPGYDKQVNMYGTENLVGLAAVNDVKKFVFASSAAVYGEPRYLPVDEQHPMNPLSPYGHNKLMAEIKVRNFENHTILRFSNIYGPKDLNGDVKDVVSIFMKQVAKGDKVTMMGKHVTRDFIYVDDVCDAIMASIERDRVGTFNISSNKQTSILELYKVIGNSLGAIDRGIRWKKLPKGEIRKIYLDNSLAKYELGWAPKTNLSRGLADMIDYQLKRKGI